HNHRTLYFLAMAKLFKNKLAAKFLTAIHLIAIYRVRDGVNSTKHNKKVFEKCTQLLSNNESILLFPEGSHNRNRYIRPLQSGFSKISYDFLQNNPNSKLYIIPVGLNYSSMTKYPAKTKIIYGDKILANAYFEENYRKFTGKLIEKTSASLKEIIVHIPKENYAKTINNINPDEFLTPKKTNKKITTDHYLNKNNNPLKKHSKKNIFYRLMQINTLGAFLFWYWLKPKIKTPEFISTAKFSIGLGLFPIVYLTQSVVIYLSFNLLSSVTYLLLSVLIVFLSSKTN
ncbi:MAG TPA: hypothetical protein ENK67_04330, partial [Flavobacteriia bacterium]|nr:hypothetical protein [Flavobacteriia bacterium]